MKSKCRPFPEKEISGRQSLHSMSNKSNKYSSVRTPETFIESSVLKIVRRRPDSVLLVSIRKGTAYKSREVIVRVFDSDIDRVDTIIFLMDIPGIYNFNFFIKKIFDN